MQSRASSGDHAHLGFVMLMNGDWGDTAPIRVIRKALIGFGETLP